MTLLLLAAVAVLNGLGLPWFVQVSAVLAAGGAFFLWRKQQRVLGGVLVVAAAVVLFTAGSDSGAGGPLLTPAAFAGGLLLVVGPWLWRTAQERAAERTRRIRSEERAEVAARVHDSVLQTLALIQRESADPKRVEQLSRRQERELRSWLFPEGELFKDDTLVGAIGNAAAEVEELHGVRVEVASAGNAPLDDDTRAVVLAAREAMSNAARFSGADEISVYAEADGDGISVFVRDRGVGLRPGNCAAGAARPLRVHRGANDAPRRHGDDLVDAGPGDGGRALAHEDGVVKAARRIVIVDDHGIFRAGVRSELGDSIEVVGEAGTVGEAIPLVIETDPDVVLLDVHLPDGGGQAVIAGVSPERPGVRFLALSVSDAAEDVIGVVRAGARGYVTKTISGDELTDAIHRVADGDAVFSPRLAGFVLDAFSSGEPIRDAELDELTAREREVLRLIARGYRYKEIASSLHISVKTVETHVSSVLRKLQLSSRHELTRWAAERRMI